MRRFLLLLLCGLVLVSCKSRQKDTEKYQWEVDKATSMQIFLLTKVLEDANSNKNYSHKLKESISFIKYIACIERNQRKRKRFPKAKTSCKLSTGVDI